MKTKLAGLTALLGLLIAPAVLADDDVVLRSEQGTQAAADLDTLQMDAGIGEFRVRTHAADEIRWTWEIVGDADSLPRETMQQRAAQFSLTHRVDGKRFILESEWPQDGDNDRNINDDVTERWTIYLPARLAVALDANIGEMTVEGVAGGLTLDFNIGEVDVEVPGGDIVIDSNIGEVSVRSGTATPGVIDLGVNIGEVKYSEGEQYFEAEYGFPIGQSLDLDREGEDDIRVDLNIGEIDVEVE